MAGLYCEHGRIPDGCEDCAYQAAKERGAPVPPQLHPTTPEPAKTVTVEEDTLVDVGAGVSVLVAAGDDVPADLIGKPRHPREAKAKAKAK